MIACAPHGATLKVPLAAPVAGDSRKRTSLALMLPPPNSQRGFVTIGGRPASAFPGDLRVVAGHRGLGKLDPLLSISATPGPDGSFELEVELPALLPDDLNAPIEVRTVAVPAVPR